MIPVVLIKLPNDRGFIGTFDTQNYSLWWRSEPLPGDVEEIIATEWAYGSYHVCICRMADGSYSVFLSIDYGMTWQEVLNLPVVMYSIQRIDYGWLVINASDGWYETTRSGLSWTKISSQAPNCRVVIDVGNDILLAHNGNEVFRSADKAHKWSKVLDCHNIKWRGFHGGDKTTTWTGDSYPALTGVYGRVLASAGPYLMMSDTTGEEWTMPWFWGGDPAYFMKPLGLYPLSTIRILQLVHTDCRGPTPEDNTFMARVWIPSQGIVRHVLSPNGGLNWSARFDQPFTGAYDGGLTAYSVARPNSDLIDRLVFSSQSRPNTQTGSNEPALKYSPDGGLEWFDIDIRNTFFYEGDPDELVQGGPLLEENFTKMTWVGHPCHNSGSYITVIGAFQRALSYDIGALLQKTDLKMLSMTSPVEKAMLKTIPHSARMEKTLVKALQIGAPVQDTFERGFRFGAANQETFEKTADFSGMVVRQWVKNFDMAAPVQKTKTAKWDIGGPVQGQIENGFGMSALLVRSRFDQLYLDIEKLIPQEIWLVVENWPSRLFNSADDEEDED